MSANATVISYSELDVTCRKNSSQWCTWTYHQRFSLNGNLCPNTFPSLHPRRQRKEQRRRIPAVRRFPKHHHNRMRNFSSWMMLLALSVSNRPGSKNRDRSRPPLRQKHPSASEPSDCDPKEIHIIFQQIISVTTERYCFQKTKVQSLQVDIRI